MAFKQLIERVQLKYKQVFRRFLINRLHKDFKLEKHSMAKALYSVVECMASH